MESKSSLLPRWPATVDGLAVERVVDLTLSPERDRLGRSAVFAPVRKHLTGWDAPAGA